MNRFLPTSLHAALMCSVLGACALGGSELSTDESSVILGGDDLIEVAENGSNVAARYRPLLDAFGKMGPSGCTATHVGNGVAVLAGHCFGKQPRARQDNISCVTQNGSAVWIDWGLRGDAGAYLHSECTKILSIQWSEKQTDYAIVAVSPVPRASVGVAFERPELDRTLTVFSHPSGRPLEWSQRCKRLAQLGPSVFGHDCDTEPGSSGAAVLDDSGLVVIGLHNGGDPGNGYNYATFLGATPLAQYLGGAPMPPEPTPDDPDLVVPEVFGNTVSAGKWVDFGPYPVTAGHTLHATLDGDGDADLFLRRGAYPELHTNDCGSLGPQSSEECSIRGPGSVYVSVYGVAPVSHFDVDVF